MLSWCHLLLLGLAALTAAEKVHYDDYRVYRVVPGTYHQLAFIAGLQDKYDQISFWRNPSKVNRPVDIMVAPSMNSRFLQALEDYDIKSSVYIENVQTLIDNERPQANREPRTVTWDDYYSLEDVYSWLDNLTAAYPTVVTPVVGGTTYEGREIRGVRVSYGEGNPIVVIESGIHADEWITVATVTFILNELLTSNDTTVRNIAESFDFYVFPSVNPDGYVYSWTTDRIWRKTRQPYPLCTGADPNRNWDFHWLEEGASNVSCSDTFAGSEPFSEVETRTLSEFLTGLGDDLQVYLAFHSYGQLLMFPYGVSSVVADNYDELLAMATRGAQALQQRYGTQYEVGSIVNAIYPAAGSSLDWVMAALSLDYAFVWELRDTGEFGMLLPADQIIPNSEETLDSILSILGDVLAATRVKANH